MGGRLKLSEEDYLKDIAARVRYDVIRSTGRAGSGHPGGSLSSAEILTSLYFGVLEYDPRNPSWADRDRFVLSKGHAAPALYSVLAQAGYFEEDELDSLREFGSILQGHPDMRKTPGVEMSTGSLGQGSSAGAGMATAAYLNDKDYEVYVLEGDGECQEGQHWEAVEHSAALGLGNLYTIVDFNGLQIDGRVEEVAPGRLEDKFGAFGWDVLSVDGHSFPDIFDAFEKTRNDRPSAIIAYTKKGKGVSFMEDKAEWHGKAAKEDLLEKALKETREKGKKVREDDFRKFVEGQRSLGIEKQPAQIPRPTGYEPKKSDYSVGEEVKIRDGFGDYINELFKTYPSIVTLCADLTESTRGKRLEDKHGTFSVRKIETEYMKGSPRGKHVRFGLREAHKVPFAAGLATCGKRPIILDFDVFYNKMTDQIRQSIAQPRLPVVMYATHSGVGVEQDGFSHQSIIVPVTMAHMPNVECYEPCSASELQEQLDLIMESNKPSYVRTTRQSVPEIERDYEITPGRGVYPVKEIEEPDVVLIGSGAMVYNVLEAGENLEKKGIDAKVLNINNYGAAYSKTHLEEEISPNTGVVTAHDAAPSCLRDIVNRRLSRSPRHNNSVVSLGIEGFGESGDKKALYRKYNLDVEGISDAAEQIIEDQKERNSKETKKVKIRE